MPDIVRVDFDGNASRHIGRRPAVVVTHSRMGDEGGSTAGGSVVQIAVRVTAVVGTPGNTNRGTGGKTLASGGRANSRGGVSQLAHS